MGDIGFVLPTGHHVKFKKYLIAYFLGQMKLLIVGQVDRIQCFDSDLIGSASSATKKHENPKLSREYISNKNNTWFLNKDTHIESSRRKEGERRERRHHRVAGGKSQCGTSCSSPVFTTQVYKNPKLSGEFIRQKNEAWFKNKDQHIENARQHFRDKSEHRRAVMQWNEAPAPSFFSRDEGPFVFGSHWTGEYYVGDHVRTGHYRMTTNGLVWVRSHGVRGHNKKR